MIKFTISKHTDFVYVFFAYDGSDHEECSSSDSNVPSLRLAGLGKTAG